MSKRNLSLVGGVVVLIGIIGFVFLSLYRHQSFSPGNTINTVPVDAAIIARLNNPDKLVHQLKNKINYRSELQYFENIESFFDVVNYADSASFFDNGPGERLLNSPVFISFNKVGKETVEWSAHLEVHNTSHKRDLKAWLDKRVVDKRNYTGFTIYEVAFGDENQKRHLYSCLQNGILTISPSSLLVETSIRQLQSGHSLSENEEFSRLQKTTGSRADGALFFNFTELADFSAPFLSPGGRHVSSVLGKIANRAGVDFNMKADGFMLNGFVTSGDNGFFMSIFDGVGVRRSSLGSILPSDTRLFLGFNFSDRARLKENFKKYLEQSETASRLETLDKRFNNQTGASYIDTFFGFLEGEFALAYSNYNASNPDEGRFMVFRTKGQAVTHPVLKELQNYFDVNTSPLGNYQVDESTSFPVYRGFTNELNELVWGQLFPQVPMQYFSFYRNYLVFADSRQSLESFLYDNVLKRTLDSHPYYSSFTENFSYEENFFLFTEIPHLHSFIGNHLDQDIFHPSREQEKVLFNFYAGGLQVSNNSGLNYATLYAKHAPHRDKEPRTIWQSRVDSMVATKPALVENHYTREKEIMVQDKANNLYLINNMGRVLWKRPLDGPVLGEIAQIDYYRNNKLQYLFNTKQKLHLLDRNGNHVARFPFTLPATASAGLAVFDYNNNKNYRIFLPLDDRKVYLFDKTGARVPGWNIPRTEGIVNQPVQFFRTSGKDYIVFSDRYRNYILDRRGNHRVTPDIGFVRNSSSPFYLEYPDSEKSALVTTNTRGQLARVMLPSGKTSLVDKTMAEEHVEHFFLLLHESNPGYVLLKPENMKIFDANMNKVVDLDFDVPVLPVADVYEFSSSDHKIGLVSADESNIYLYNSDGSIYQGFPLKGTSRFSIGFLKSSAYRFNLITGGRNNYIYNYRVE